MMCQYVGFRLEVGAGVPKAAVIKQFVSLSGQSKKRATKERFFSVGESGEYVVGRWGCLRGRNKQVIADTTTKEMIWNELPTGYEITAPNYFVFHRETFHGLYQRYPSSNSFRHFTDMLRSVAAEVRQPMLKAAMGDARAAANLGRRRKEKARPLSDDQKKEIGERFAVNCYPLIRQEKLEEILSRWQNIKALRYRVATLAPTVDRYGPLAEHTSAEVHELRLDPKTDRKHGFVGNIVSMCSWLTEKFGSRLRRTSLIGTDEGSKPRTVNLGNFVDWLGEDELDKVLTDSELNNKDVIKSELIAKMVHLCDTRPEYFHKVAK